MDFLVEKCCELGVERLVPMVTQRSVVDPMARQGNRLSRWRRIAVEAAKQSGATRLTRIMPVVEYGTALGIQEPAAAKVVASPVPDALGLDAFRSWLRPGQTVVAYVGPEGGFAPAEVEAARRAGCAMVSLGTRTLRVETAAVALAACLLLGD